MPKGLKPTSSPIQISASVTEAVAGTLAIDQIDLTLNVLDNEVFVVTQINIDLDSPDSVGGLSTAVDATVSTTRRATVGSIADQNVLASANRQIVCNAGMTPDGGIPFDREDPLFSALEMDYLGIIATNNAFLNLVGTNNGNVKQVRARIYGYRATADSSTYAALVQSELLSA
jgi:hypothetical protein